MTSLPLHPHSHDHPPYHLTTPALITLILTTLLLTIIILGLCIAPFLLTPSSPLSEEEEELLRRSVEEEEEEEEILPKYERGLYRDSFDRNGDGEEGGGGFFEGVVSPVRVKAEEAEEDYDRDRDLDTRNPGKQRQGQVDEPVLSPTTESYEHDFSIPPPAYDTLHSHFHSTEASCSTSSSPEGSRGVQVLGRVENV